MEKAGLISLTAHRLLVIDQAIRSYDRAIAYTTFGLLVLRLTFQLGGFDQGQSIVNLSLDALSIGVIIYVLTRMFRHLLYRWGEQKIPDDIDF